MLQVFHEKSSKITKTEKKEDGLYLYSERGILRLCPVNKRCVRVTYTERDRFSNRKNPGIVAQKPYKDWEYEEKEGKILLLSGEVTVVVSLQRGSCTYLDADGRLLLREREEACRSLEEFQTYKVVEGEDLKTERIQTADGEKSIVREAVREADRLMYHTRLNLSWQEGEALYGLGQHEEGILNLRGHKVYLHQANRKIAIPMLISSLGYGVLVNTDSTLIFSDTEDGSYIYTEADEEQDYFFLYGGNMDGVVREYRTLTGKAALLPRWTFGYLQSQERYETAEEILAVIGEYRKRGIGLDGIVLDWCSWEDGKWGQKTLDPKRFPAPGRMIDTLHENKVHFMISVWPNMDENCENYREMKETGNLLPGSNIYNAFSEEARKLYWKQAEEGLFRHGIDGWWCDNSEPATPEWNHMVRQEPSVMYCEYCKTTADLLPSGESNSYALYHAQALYEGQRGSRILGAQDKRVVNLTRSAWTGQQRYGTILWSGDTAASWDTLKKQIAAGLNFSASGLPFWTVDIGAFFVKRGEAWYWKGDYDDTLADAGYRELFVRWFQWGAFLPVFRGHGTDCYRELWRFSGEECNAGEAGNRFYEALCMANRMRYTLLPYLYSLAGRCWLEDGSMIRLLAFDFPEDRVVTDRKDQYMFGESLMICPVTEPMYFGVGSVPIAREQYSRRVYLPGNEGWYDFWTGNYYTGGQWIEAEAPLERIPVFVREGSVLPLVKNIDTAEMLSADCVAGLPVVFRVYAGRDAVLRYYNDSGDGYGYEKGEYTLTEYHWSEAAHKLTDADGRECVCEIIEKKY